jgi:GH15 family glucan-1,4-alpha-glucosidase
MEDATMTYQPIENYGIIGDLYTVALVGTDDSIDFMSFPHFDSPTVFAALLDHQKGGHFRVAPVLEDAQAPYRVEQRDGEIVFVSQGPDKTALRLRTPIPVRVENGAV